MKKVSKIIKICLNWIISITTISDKKDKRERKLFLKERFYRVSLLKGKNRFRREKKKRKMLAEKVQIINGLFVENITKTL